MKKRFTEAQIVGFLREADAGIPVKDLCRKHGFSDGAAAGSRPAIASSRWPIAIVAMARG